jgi:hypothetical protein
MWGHTDHGGMLCIPPLTSPTVIVVDVGSTLKPWALALLFNIHMALLMPSPVLVALSVPWCPSPETPSTNLCPACLPHWGLGFPAPSSISRHSFQPPPFIFPLFIPMLPGWLAHSCPWVPPAASTKHRSNWTTIGVVSRGGLRGVGCVPTGLHTEQSIPWL